MGVRVKDPSTGQFKEIYVKALDSLPVGAEIDFDGDSADIPDGWEVVDSWKLAGQVQGSTSITIPDNFEELLIVSEENNNQQYSKIIIKPMIKNGYYIYDGYDLSGDSTNNFCGCAWQFTNNGTKINLVVINRGGTNYTSNATTYLYYK